MGRANLAGSDMQFRVLGPLEVDHRGEPIDLGSPKQREVLSFLLMHAGRSVSADRIIDAVWGDTDGHNPLYIAVSRLRSALDAAGNGEVLTTQNKAYTLEVDPRSIDADRFEAMARAARRDLESDPVAARSTLEEALALWRGPAWEDVRYRDFALADAERLEELRAGAIEDLLDLRLSAGETTSVVADARAHHEAYPLRERPVELLMVALYRSGRQAEALQVYSAFASALDAELGLEPSPHLQSVEERILLHDPVVASRTDRAVRAANPYRGLEAFQERDTDRFFGRDRLIDETVELLRSGAGLVTLVGASGSGKSSIVRAGVVPAVRAGALSGHDWLVAVMVPGARPFLELEAALIQATGDAAAGRVGDGDEAVLRAGLGVCGSDRRLLLVVDQFEELFTITDREADRRRFLEGLALASDDPHGRVRVLLTLRADHYGPALAYPAFAERFGRGIVNVGPLLPAELEDAAVSPAAQADLEIDPALLATLIADVSGQAGALPHFQYTLTHLADGADGVLTLADYRAAGGVTGALTRQADNTYARLDLDAQEACRQLFLRMVAVGSDGAWTRRRLPLVEARGLGLEPGVLQSVIAELVAARLVTTDRGALDDQPTLEVAHESLLTEWHRLAGWLDAAAADIRRHRGLSMAATQWGQSDEDPSYLWKGLRLAEHVEWSERSAVELSDGERRFLTVAEEAERAESQRAANDARRARLRAVGLVALVVAFVGVGSFALWQALIPEPFEVVVLDAADGPTAAQFDAGLEEVDDRLGMLGVRLLPGVDTGADIESALQAGPSRIIVSRDAPGAFPPDYWVELGDRVTGQIFDFSLGGVAPVDHPSWTRVSFADDEASFIAGAVAATRTETGVVGFVGALSGHLSWARAGFEAGVAHVDPAVRVVSAMTPVVGHPFAGYDRDAADRVYQTTSAVLDEGADVVFVVHGDAGVGGVSAIADASTDSRPVWAIVHDFDGAARFSDLDPALGEVVLTSVVRRYDRAVFRALERSQAEKTEAIRVSFADEGFELPGDRLTVSEQQLVADLSDEMRFGRDLLGELSDAYIDFPLSVPDRAPSILPGDAVEVDVDLTPSGPSIAGPETLRVGDLVVVRAENSQVSRQARFVAFGRLRPEGLTPIRLEDGLAGLVWRQPDLFDVGSPRDWAVLNRQGTAALVVEVDQPGTWVVGAGIVDWTGRYGEPVTWWTFEVSG